MLDALSKFTAGIAALFIGAVNTGCMFLSIFGVPLVLFAMCSGGEEPGKPRSSIAGPSPGSQVATRTREYRGTSAPTVPTRMQVSRETPSLQGSATTSSAIFRERAKALEMPSEFPLIGVSGSKLKSAPAVLRSRSSIVGPERMFGFRVQRGVFPNAYSLEVDLERNRVNVSLDSGQYWLDWNEVDAWWLHDG